MLISDWSSDVCSSDLGEGRSCEASLVPDHADTAADLWRLEKCPRQIHRILRRDDLLRAVQPGSRATQSQSSWADRKSVVKGKSVSVRVDLGGRRILKTNRDNRYATMLSKHSI